MIEKRNLEQLPGLPEAWYYDWDYGHKYPILCSDDAYKFMADRLEGYEVVKDTEMSIWIDDEGMFCGYADFVPVELIENLIECYKGVSDGRYQ